MGKKEELIEMIGFQYREDVFEALSDEALMEDFLAAKSTKKEAAVLKKVLLDNGMSLESWESVYEEYGPKLVKAGTKGVVRGGKLNKIIFDMVSQIISNNGVSAQFEISREKHPEPKLTSELPDFMVKEKSTGKILIGMVQFDMWTGGQQINRLDKYIKKFSDDNKGNKLLAVVVKPFEITSRTRDDSKTFNLIFKGISNGVLVFPGALEKSIKDFFDL